LSQSLHWIFAAHCLYHEFSLNKFLYKPTFFIQPSLIIYPLKILILSFYYAPDLSAGSFRTSALVNAMLDQLPSTAHIDVITTLPNRYNTFNSDALEFEVHQQLTINRIALPSHKSGMFDQSKAFVEYAKGVLRLSRGKNYDLIYATSSRLMTAVLGAYLSKLIGSKLYLDIRDIFVDTIKDVLPKKNVYLIKPIFSFLEWWTVRRALKINLVSEGFLTYFRKRYPKKEITLYTNGIDQEFIENQPRLTSSCGSRVLSVVYAGNMGEGQGLHTIIPELARRFAGRLQFNLIGDGGRKQQLLSALDFAGSTNVHILPPVKRSELIKIYQSADILFLHLNDYDAFKKVLPSKIFEYGALGKPIWAGVAGYAAEFVKKNITNAVVFVPCDVDDAVKSFNSLEIVTRPRLDFVENFARSNIMQKMASDIISTAEVDVHAC
jgi:glycosyltransferase involved in cell wall biosynthesis